MSVLEAAASCELIFELFLPLLGFDFKVKSFAPIYFFPNYVDIFIWLYYSGLHPFLTCICDSPDWWNFAWKKAFDTTWTFRDDTNEAVIAIFFSLALIKLFISDLENWKKRVVNTA